MRHHFCHGKCLFWASNGNILLWLRGTTGRGEYGLNSLPGTAKRPVRWRKRWFWRRLSIWQGWWWHDEKTAIRAVCPYQFWLLLWAGTTYMVCIDYRWVHWHSPGVTLWQLAGRLQDFPFPWCQRELRERRPLGTGHRSNVTRSRSNPQLFWRITTRRMSDTWFVIKSQYSDILHWMCAFKQYSQTSWFISWCIQI